MKSLEIPHSVRELGSKIGEQVHKLGNPFKPKSLATNVGVLQIGISRGPKTTETIYPPYTDDREGGITAAPVEEEEAQQTTIDTYPEIYHPGKLERFITGAAQHFAKPFRIATATALGTAGGYALSQNTEVREFVDARYHDAMNMLKKEVVIPDTFDPTAKKGVIGENNSVKLTPEAAQTEIKEGSLSTPIMVRLPEGYTGPIHYEIQNNRQLVLSELPIDTEIISTWKGKINQGTWKFTASQDGSQESLQSFITAQDENEKEFTANLSTGRVKLTKDIPRSDLYPKLKDDSVPAAQLNEGEVIATIASTANSKYFDGQVSISAASLQLGGTIPIQVQTKDGKAVKLQ